MTFTEALPDDLYRSIVAPSKNERQRTHLILSCPPAGPTTADESLFSMVLPGGNFVFTFVLGARSCARLEGWQRATEIGCCRFRRSSCRSRAGTTSGAVHPSFETPCCARLLVRK